MPILAAIELVAFCASSIALGWLYGSHRGEQRAWRAAERELRRVQVTNELLAGENRRLRGVQSGRDRRVCEDIWSQPAKQR